MQRYERGSSQGGGKIDVSPLCYSYVYIDNKNASEESMVVINPPPNEQQLAEHHLPFEELYERYFLRVYRYFRAHLSSEDDVADLVQQVFFQVWMQLRTYRPERGSFATWVFSIAHHRLVDFYRASRLTDSWEAIDEIIIVEQSPEDLVISAETFARIKDLLDALSPSDRELLALRFGARLSIAEIAATLGKSVAATKKQLSRLIERLRKQYRRQEQEEQQPGLSEMALPAFVIALQLVYAVSPPAARQAILRQMALAPSRHKVEGNILC